MFYWIKGLTIRNKKYTHAHTHTRAWNLCGINKSKQGYMQNSFAEICQFVLAFFMRNCKVILFLCVFCIHNTIKSKTRTTTVSVVQHRWRIGRKTQPVSQSVSLKSTQKYINIIGFWLVCDDNRKSTNNHRYAHNSSCHWECMCVWAYSRYRPTIHCLLYVCSALYRRTGETPLTVSNKSSRNELCVLWLNSIDLQDRSAGQQCEEQSIARRMANQHNSWKYKRNWCWPKWMVKTNRTTTLISLFWAQFLDLLFEFWWCAFRFARLLWMYDFLRISSLVQYSRPIIEVKFDSHYVTLIANEVHTKWFELWWWC